MRKPRCLRIPFDLKDEADLMTALERCPYQPGALLEREDPGDGAEALSTIAACSERSAELYQLLGLFCHTVRNKLNSLHLCLYILDAEGEGEDWSEAMGHYRETMQVIDAIQTICRPLTLDLADLPFDLLIDDRADCWREMLNQRGVRLELQRPRQGEPVAFDPSRMSQALDDLVRWRSEQAQQGTSVSLMLEDRRGLGGAGVVGVGRWGRSGRGFVLRIATSGGSHPDSCQDGRTQHDRSGASVPAHVAVALASFGPVPDLTGLACES